VRKAILGLLDVELLAAVGAGSDNSVASVSTRDAAMKLLDDLIVLGEELRTALLRNVTKGLRNEP